MAPIPIAPLALLLALAGAYDNHATSVAIATAPPKAPPATHPSSVSNARPQAPAKGQTSAGRPATYSSSPYHAATAPYHAPSGALQSNSASFGTGGHPVLGLRSGRIADPVFYRSVTVYHNAQYQIRLNPYYALHPAFYPHGYWGAGWYHGYWHGYWAHEPWLWYNGAYGFWLSLAGTEVFVREVAPGVCSYWNGAGWVPWWNPPYTPYYCPY
jgi:hypothetical protein